MMGDLRMKKKFGRWMMLWCVVLGVLCTGTTVQAADGKTSVAVSKSTVDIGETITVTATASDTSGAKAVATMTLSYDSSILQFVSCSSSVYSGGGNSVGVVSDSFSVTLKAIAPGQSAVSLSASDGVSFDTNEELGSMAGSSATVTVNNAASAPSGGDTPQGGGQAGGGTSQGGGQAGGGTSQGGGQAGGGTSQGGDSNVTGTVVAGQQSADNSLKSLTLSSGTLSPSFVGNVTKYTATVEHSVTDLAVTAVPVNEKATVESVTGNTGLKDGTNTVKIVVRAENGVTATYTVTVTRKAEGAGDTKPAEEPEKPPVITEEPTENVLLDGVSYQISDDFKSGDIPEDFSETTVTYHEKEYRGVQYEKGAVVLLYLIAAEGEQKEGAFYLYDAPGDMLYPFVRMVHGDRSVIVLPLPADTAVPESYQQAVFETVDGAKVSGLFDTVAAEPDFYLFYAMNQDGFGGWYQYDILEGTYQRNAGIVQTAASGEETEEPVSVDMEKLQEEYQNLSEKYKKEKAFSRNVIGALIFLAAVLLVVIINLLLHRRKRGDEWEDFDDEEEDFDDRGFEEKMGPRFAEGGRMREKAVRAAPEPAEKPRQHDIPAPPASEGEEKPAQAEKKVKEIEIIDFNDL